MELSGLYALFPDEQHVFSFDAAWPDPWPLNDRQGVYLIFDNLGRNLYDGKASMGSWLGFRLGCYFVGKRTGQCRIVPWDAWEIGRPFYVATIAVPQGMGFEPPALEEYLIAELKPIINKCGK